MQSSFFWETESFALKAKDLKLEIVKQNILEWYQEEDELFPTFSLGDCTRKMH